MNKFGVLVGIAATITVTGGLAAYAAYESDIVRTTPSDAKDSITEFTDELENSELGYGQLEKQEGAYSP
jgi:hypothetical protein